MENTTSVSPDSILSHNNGHNTYIYTPATTSSSITIAARSNETFGSNSPLVPTSKSLSINSFMTTTVHNTVSLISTSITTVMPSHKPSQATTSPTLTKTTANHSFVNETVKAASSLTSQTISDNGEDSSDGESFFLIAFISIFVSTIIVLGILMLIRKSRLDRIRHHLMPVYNFDPTEDGEDWETELLEEPFAQQQSSYSNDGANKPSIKLDSGLTGGLNLKTANNLSKSTKLTPSSGLLSSENNNSCQSGRYLYTNERPIV